MSNSRQDGALEILVLDDEPLVLRSITMMLEALGHSVAQATHGQEVLDLLTQRPQLCFDVAILDVTIHGGIGGAEIAPQVREQLPDIKLVVTSGHEATPVMADWRQFGFDAVLPKPFTLSDLSSVVEQVCAPQMRVKSTR